MSFPVKGKEGREGGKPQINSEVSEETERMLFPRGSLENSLP